MRKMRLLSAGRLDIATVRDPEEASTVGRYWNAVKEFLGTGDDWVLHDFVGVIVAGFELETDPDVIEDLALAGQLRFREIYAS